MKLLAVDLDNTLLKKDHSISEYTLNSIRRMEELGHYFVIDTGRPAYRTNDVLRMIGHNDKNHYAICFNGGLIINGVGEKIYSIKLKDEEVKELVELGKSLNNIGTLVYLDDHIEYDYLCDAVSFLGSLACMKKNPSGKDGLKELKEVYKVLFIGSEKDIINIKRSIPKTYFERFNIVQSGTKWIEIMPKMVDKGQGIKKLCNILGIDMNDTYAVGDEENDLSMLKCVKHPCAVMNAVDSVKQIATYISSSNE